MKFALCLLALSFCTALHADPSKFDLTGPKLDIRVTRGNDTLPIAEVPNLQPGDKLWIKADLPQTQSNHLLIIVAFLRGTTNEPPDSWFTEIDTWDKKKTKEGTTIVVPDEAQQAILFIAPETGGDFKTLRSAVKGRPGIFIRADADLNESSFEQQRIEHYLDAMKTVTQNDPKAIADHSAKLAATLALKPNADCFKQPVEQQVTCLTQSSEPVILTDGHGQSIADALSSGASSDLINSASLTQQAGGGIYSAYVGTVIDLVHLVSLMRTAQYQYIPGLSFPDDATINLKLNAPPSFVNPKSVIVVGLPAIQPAKLPPLKPHDPDEVACLLQPKMALQLEGAPLVFSTNFAHDIILHLNRTGAPTDIPLKPDAFEGGLIVTKEEARKALRLVNDRTSEDATSASGNKLGSSSDLDITGTISGYWGFDPFTGPTLKLQQVDGKGWKIVGDTQLMAGQDNHLTLTGEGTACVQKVALTDNKNKDVTVSFKPATDDSDKDKPNTLALDVSLKKVQPGGYSLGIRQYGDATADRVPLTAYNAAIHMDSLKIHTGDDTAELTGSGLDNVVSVELDKQNFTPTGDANSDSMVHLEAKDAVSPAKGSEAVVKLKDGRTMKVKVYAEAPRPGLQLLSFHATPAQQAGAIPVTLGATDDIPLNGKLTFVVQTKEIFPRNQKIEVATADGTADTTLSLADNDLVLQDEHTVVATLDPLKAFGQSAFGPLQMRPVAADGTPGDWTPLGKLVRTPQITAVNCTTADAPTCTVNGDNFFLVQSFGAAQDFAKPADVPTGFADSTFTVPTPADGSTLYLKLRDDPTAVAKLTLPTPIPKPAPPPPAAAAQPAPAAPASTSATTSTPAPAAQASPAAATPADSAPSSQVPATSVAPATTPPTSTPPPAATPSIASQAPPTPSATAPAATPSTASATPPAVKTAIQPQL
ncbi:hypothetical protein GOB94_09270 [Granulicella sp. 5B5]|nr:hypothetical protein GOB94_09270 [Granulicella sp. 5B5]